MIRSASDYNIQRTSPLRSGGVQSDRFSYLHIILQLFGNDFRGKIKEETEVYVSVYPPG